MQRVTNQVDNFSKIPLNRKYFKDKKKTAEALRGGWLHTGDIGKLDEDGFLYFVDRIKDMIKTGGENVASTDVEEVILSHPKVAEVAVFAV